MQYDNNLKKKIIKKKVELHDLLSVHALADCIYLFSFFLSLKTGNR